MKTYIRALHLRICKQFYYLINHVKKKLKKQNATSNSPSYLEIFAHDAVLKSVRKEIIQRLSFHLRSLLTFTFSHHSQIHTVKTSASLRTVSFFA